MYWNLKRVLTMTLVMVFVGTIFYYSYYQSRGIIAGPSITLIAPHDGDEVTVPLVHVQGVAKQAKELTLDGRAIFVDLSGKFDEQLLLYSGYNIIELAAKDAEGREEKKTVRIVWNGTTSPVFPTASSSSDQTATGT